VASPPSSPAASSGPVFPVSVKGVVFRDGRVLLLRNERQEWELPGGRLEIGETPEACVAREIAEETGWDVKVGALLDAWVYQPLPERLPDRRVLIVTYGCATTATDRPTRSSEHDEIGLFSLQELGGLRLPDGYRRSIAAWAGRLAEQADEQA
jgi:8-oxo-dGTP pyrophosphatase MutT (NUDIX family)